MFDKAIGALRFAGVESVEIQQLHFSNHAIDVVFGGDTVQAFELHNMWVDADIEGHEDALEMAGLIEAIAPGQFVLVDTGDYIRNENPEFDSYEFECYDPRYRLVLIPKTAFDARRQELERVDAAWREMMQRRANGETVQPARNIASEVAWDKGRPILGPWAIGVK